jgi:hypothetical protein
MKRITPKIGFFVALIALVLSIAAYAQQEDHSQHQTQAQKAVEEEHIFCPTMKTGQVCTHGTAATLGVAAEQNDQWVAMARKYNRAVNAATEQLFKDAEGVLTSEQQKLLKAWFAVGLNPEINQILYKKGLGSASQKH